jgi:hypothetical protein
MATHVTSVSVRNRPRATSLALSETAALIRSGRSCPSLFSFALPLLLFSVSDRRLDFSSACSVRAALAALLFRFSLSLCSRFRIVRLLFIRPFRPGRSSRLFYFASASLSVPVSDRRLAYNEGPRRSPIPSPLFFPTSPWLPPPSRACSSYHRSASEAIATSSSRGLPGLFQSSFSSTPCFAAPCSWRTTCTPTSRSSRSARRRSGKIIRSRWRCAR